MLIVHTLYWLAIFISVFGNTYLKVSITLKREHYLYMM